MLNLMGKLKRRVWWIAVGLAVLPFLLLGISSAMANRPDNLGVKNGQLAACPDSPNCVCTQATDEQHAIESIPLTISPEDAMQHLKTVLKELPRTEVITADKNYLYAECTSFLFRFVDDIEFYIDEPARQIHFRSASRVGRSDLGVNRKRMETIRSKYLALSHR